MPQVVPYVFSLLHGPSMLPDKAKCRVLYNRSSFIVLDETSSYRSVTKSLLNSRLLLVNISKSGSHWSAFGNQQGSTFTETNRNGLIHHIGTGT